MTEHVEGDPCKFALWVGRTPTSDNKIVLKVGLPFFPLSPSLILLSLSLLFLPFLLFRPLPPCCGVSLGAFSHLFHLGCCSEPWCISLPTLVHLSMCECSSQTLVQAKASGPRPLNIGGFGPPGLFAVKTQSDSTDQINIRQHGGKHWQRSRYLHFVRILCIASAFGY